MSKVYIKVDDQNRVVACDGGYSIGNVDVETWIFIDEGEADRFNLCQGNYFDALRDENGIPRYKWNGSEVVLRSDEEIAADVAALPPAPKTMQARIDELEQTLSALITFHGLTVRDMGNGVLEVVKPELPSGDYVNPIPFTAGMSVEIGLFYTDGADIWECVEAGTATAFTAPWFDVIGG